MNTGQYVDANGDLVTYDLDTGNIISTVPAGQYAPADATPPASTPPSGGGGSNGGPIGPPSPVGVDPSKTLSAQNPIITIPGGGGYIYHYVDPTTGESTYSPIQKVSLTPTELQNAELAKIQAETQRILAGSTGAAAGASTTNANIAAQTAAAQLAAQQAQWAATNPSNNAQNNASAANLNAQAAATGAKTPAEVALLQAQAANIPAALEVQKGTTLLGLGSRPDTLIKYLYALRGQQTPQGLMNTTQSLPGFGTAASTPAPAPAPATTPAATTPATTPVAAGAPGPGNNAPPGTSLIPGTVYVGAGGVGTPVPSPSTGGMTIPGTNLTQGTSTAALQQQAAANGGVVAGPGGNPIYTPGTPTPALAGVGPNVMGLGSPGAPFTWGAGITPPPPPGGGSYSGAGLPVGPPQVPAPPLAYAQGGVIPEPVIGIGLHSGQTYKFGEEGPEAVVPNEDLPPDIGGPRQSPDAQDRNKAHGGSYLDFINSQSKWTTGQDMTDQWKQGQKTTDGRRNFVPPTPPVSNGYDEGGTIGYDAPAMHSPNAPLNEGSEIPAIESIFKLLHSSMHTSPMAPSAAIGDTDNRYATGGTIGYNPIQATNALNQSGALNPGQVNYNAPISAPAAAPVQTTAPAPVAPPPPIAAPAPSSALTPVPQPGYAPNVPAPVGAQPVPQPIYVATPQPTPIPMPQVPPPVGPQNALPPITPPAPTPATTLNVPAIDPLRMNMNTPGLGAQAAGFFNDPRLAQVVARGFNSSPLTPLFPQIGIATNAGQSLVPSQQRWNSLLPSEQALYQGALQDEFGAVPGDVTTLSQKLAPKATGLRTPKFVN